MKRKAYVELVILRRLDRAVLGQTLDNADGLVKLSLRHVGGGGTDASRLTMSSFEASILGQTLIVISPRQFPRSNRLLPSTFVMVSTPLIVGGFRLAGGIAEARDHWKDTQ